MGESKAQDYLKHATFLSVYEFLISWASRPYYYAMNSYSLTATTVVCSGTCLKAALYFILFFSD